MKRSAFVFAYRVWLTVIGVAAFGLIFGSTGCGGGSSKSAANTQSGMPTPSASQPGAGSGGSGSASGGTSNPGNSGGSSGGSSSAGSSGSGGSSGGSGAGGGNSATSISGTILNSQTGVPVSGTVAVALEGADPSDFSIFAQTIADAQGQFRFDNVVPSPHGWGWTIGVSAKSSDGTLFAPTLLVSATIAGRSGDAIEPGTDVGAITLVPSPTGTIRGNIFSQNVDGMPQSVNVLIDPMWGFALDRNFTIPWIDGAPKFTTHDSDPACGTQGYACSVYTITMPTANVWLATYDRNGNQFHTSGTPVSYKADFNASSVKTGASDCLPATLLQHWGGFGSKQEIVASADPHFQSCSL